MDYQSSPPAEQNEYFTLSIPERKLAFSHHKKLKKVYFILQLGYFKAKIL